MNESQLESPLFIAHTADSNWLAKLEIFVSTQYGLTIDSQFFASAVSPLIIELPHTVKEQIERSIHALHISFQKIASKDLSKNQHSRHPSVLMAYDFHLDKDLQPKLIEVNTNASGYLVMDAIYNSSNDSLADLRTQLIRTFKSSYQAFNSDTSCELSHILITDETLNKQYMLPEMRMYQSLFKQHGFTSRLLDTHTELKIHIDQLSKDGIVPFVYNRYCDFLLERPHSQFLKNLYIKRKICLSPHPDDYAMFALKTRMNQLTQNWNILPEAAQLSLLKSWSMVDFETFESLWKKRKGLFFKPQQSFGGKGTYNGKSISRKKMEAIYTQPFTVQELCPAPQASIKDTSEAPVKFDIRVFTFDGQPQLYCARVFRGQVMNFRDPVSGFSRLLFV